MGLDFGGFAVFLLELIAVLCVSTAPLYTMYQSPTDMGYLVTVYLPEEAGVPVRHSVAHFDLGSAIQGAARAAAFQLFSRYHAALAEVGRAEWPHQLEGLLASTSTALPLVSTSVFPSVPPRAPFSVPTFAPPPVPAAPRPPLYPTVPPTRPESSARPRVFRGSSSRAAPTPSTPYERPPTPQFVQDLIERVDTLQRRCSQLERENDAMSAALRDYTLHTFDRPGVPCHRRAFFSGRCYPEFHRRSTTTTTTSRSPTYRPNSTF